MSTALAVVAGGLGALARYEMGGRVQAAARTPLPLGTLAVNVVGAAVLGVVVGLGIDGAVDADTVRVVGTGFLGGFTTFSTWMVDTVAVAQDGTVGGPRRAVANLLVMLAAGLVATGLGLALGRLLG